MPFKTNVYKKQTKYNSYIFLLPLANSVEQIFTGSISIGLTELLVTLIFLILIVSYFYKNPTYIIESFDFTEVKQVVDAYLSKRSNSVTKNEPQLKIIIFSSDLVTISLKKVSDFYCSIKYSEIKDQAIIDELNCQIEPIISRTPSRDKWLKNETLALKIMLILSSIAIAIELFSFFYQITK